MALNMKAPERSLHRQDISIHDIPYAEWLLSYLNKDFDYLHVSC